MRPIEPSTGAVKAMTISGVNNVRKTQRNVYSVKEMAATNNRQLPNQNCLAYRVRVIHDARGVST